MGEDLEHWERGPFVSFSEQAAGRKVTGDLREGAKEMNRCGIQMTIRETRSEADSDDDTKCCHSGRSAVGNSS